jgi:hypothetical protein
MRWETVWDMLSEPDSLTPELRKLYDDGIKYQIENSDMFQFYSDYELQTWLTTYIWNRTIYGLTDAIQRL